MTGTERVGLDALSPLRLVRRLGRARTWHLSRVLIEDGRVVIRTQCGLQTTDGEWTETVGVPTCDDCQSGDPLRAHRVGVDRTN